MNHSLIIFGIQATLRAGQAGADLHGENARDRKIFLPDINLSPDTKETKLRQFLDENQEFAARTPGISEHWDKESKLFMSSDPNEIDLACSVMLQYKAQKQLEEDGKDKKTANYEAKMLAAGRMVEQWREEKKPPSPAIRFALTLTDIGLEFVASNPSIFGVGSRGEKLICAFAGNLSGLIPNTMDDFGNKEGFADRVLRIFLRAGLGALSDNTGVVFNDDDVEKLVKGVVEPIVKSLPANISEQFEFRTLVDALAGPSAEAVFKLLAENTETYFGKDFSNDKALGAVTSALFEEIKTTSQGGSIVDTFSKQGVIRLYQAALGVAVEQPELFTGGDESAESKLFGKLLSRSAELFQEYPQFKGPVCADLTAMAIRTVGENAPALMGFNAQAPWETIVENALKQMTAGLADVLETKNENDSLKGALKAFDETQLTELGQIVLKQTVSTPGMMGIEEPEIRFIIVGVAEAMAADDNLLLSAEEWLQIAGVAAQKASANPGRLFNLSVGDDGENALAFEVLSSILKAAGETWASGGRVRGALLFGETLKLVLEEALHALSGNIDAVSNKPELVGAFMNEVLNAGKAHPEKMGSEGLLNVFKTFISTVLGKGELPGKEQIIDCLSA